MKVQHPLDWQLSRKPVRRDVAPMGEIYSHLSEEERQVIQIEILLDQTLDATREYQYRRPADDVNDAPRQM